MKPISIKSEKDKIILTIGDKIKSFKSHKELSEYFNKKKMGFY